MDKKPQAGEFPYTSCSCSTITTKTTILYSAEENFDKIIGQPAEIAKLVEAGCDIIYLDYLL